MKGNPIKENIPIIIHLIIKGLNLKKSDKNRISWFPIKLWITKPAHKNNIDLKIAWTIKWKNAKLVNSNDKVNIIIDSCLRVEKAIIFLRSFSKKALIPDIIIVINEIFIKKVLKILLLNSKSKRIRRYTPAVTKVDEWTKAETGVGAAIAAGSHAEKGIWALLVKPAMIINNPQINSKFFMELNSNELKLTAKIIIIINITSPIRLLIIVIIPEL